MLVRQGSKSKVFLYDPWLLSLVTALLALSLLMVASASMVISDRLFHTPFHFLIHQGFYISIGLFICLVVINIPIRFWQKQGLNLLLLSVVLLVMVFIPGIGREINGSRRWLGFGGLGIEVSEAVKFAVILYSAGYIVRHREEIRTKLGGFIRILALLFVLAVLLLLEPDYGATLVIFTTVLGMMFLAGARLREFSVIVVLGAVAFAALALLSPYRLARLTAFLDPWARPFDSGYQLTQSLIAFGRGGLWGVGIGNSIQKLFYLPEAHTDFLFAVYAEEFGVVGQLLVLGLFSALIGRIFYLGRLMEKKLDNQFAGYIAYGIAILFSLQVIINIGVNMGILPTKGLTLPFMSYGGSSMMFSFAYLGVLLRIHHEASLSEGVKL